MRDFTLAVIVIVLGIMAMVAVGPSIERAFSTQTDQRWQEDINSLSVAMTPLGYSTAGYGTACYTDAFLVNGKFVPKHLINASNNIVNEFGGTYAMCGNTRRLWVYTSGIPMDVCIRMLSMTGSIQSSKQIRVGASLAAAQAATPIAAANIPPATAVTQCAGATNTVGFEVGP